MNHTWELFGIIAALVIWGGLGLVMLYPHLKRQFARVIERARTAPARTILGAIAVGIAIAYGGTKPTVVHPAFSYTKNGDGTATLLTVTNSPTVSSLVISNKIDGLTVVALADNFCKGTVAANFTSVTIPASVVSIGDGFFGLDGSGRKYLKQITVATENPYCALSVDGVLYEIDTGRVIYALGDINDVRFKIAYNKGEGSGTIDAEYKIYGESHTLTTNRFTRSGGYEQIGWATSKGCAAIEYFLGGKYADDQGLTLYPVWRECLCDSELTKHFEKGEKYTVPSAPQSRVGYEFGGWKMNGTVYKPGAILTFSKTGDYVFYAVWYEIIGEPTQYIVRFINSDGTLLTTMQCDPNKVYKLPDVSEITATDKFICGWRCSNGRCYDDGVLVFDLGDSGETVTMEAIWEAK